MRIFSKAVLAIAVAIALTGCTPALNDEAACEEVNKFAGEATSTVRNMTENIADSRSLRVYANRLVEIAGEIEALNIANDEISDALGDWGGSTREIGEFFSSGWEFGDAADPILPAFDRFEIANNKMIRLCDL